MSKIIPNREAQRQIVLTSQFYLSGEEFTRNHIGPLLGLSSEGAAHLLSSMATDGLLARRQVKQGNRQFIQYSRPLSKVARLKWRKRTNQQLGLTPSNLLGAAYV